MGLFPSKPKGRFTVNGWQLILCNKQPGPDMIKHLLTFGDSNTHGTPPLADRTGYERFDEQTRWPSLTAASLQCHLAKEGLPGRTTNRDDPVCLPLSSGEGP